MGRRQAEWVERARPMTALQALDPLDVLVGGLAVIIGLGSLGIVHLRDVPHTWLVNLDAEHNLPALWSGLLLLVAAALALALRHRPGLRPVAALSGLFAFMALDEVVTIHEHLESWTGVAWEILYAPVTLAAVVACALLWSRLGGVPWARVTLMLGGAAWVLAQGLENAQMDGGLRVQGYNALMAAEELGEMTGSLLFIVALQCIRWAWPVDDTVDLAGAGRLAVETPVRRGASWDDGPGVSDYGVGGYGDGAAWDGELLEGDTWEGDTWEGAAWDGEAPEGDTWEAGAWDGDAGELEPDDWVEHVDDRAVEVGAPRPQDDDGRTVDAVRSPDA